MTMVVRLARDVVERRLDRFLGAAVERAGGLVEDQDRRVLQQGAGDRHPLLLAARQLQPALADHQFIALRQAAMKWSIAAPLAAASMSACVAPSRP